VTDASSPGAEIEAVVTAINQAWLEHRFDELGAYFDDAIVMVAPDGVLRVTGRADGVRTFEEFMRRATVEHFEVFDVTVDAWGDTAVATYDFDIIFELDGQRFDESGRELWVFASDSDTWRARWRTQLPKAS
jgi:ketosteroid isomerase-like protein